MINIGIVEDNNTLRNSLQILFNHTDGMRCVVCLSNLLNVVSDISKNKPDIILMDIGLPNISGIEGVRTVKSSFPEIQMLMFTVFEDNEIIFEAIRAGANGYLLKKAPSEEIVESIRELYHGGAPMSPSIARKVVQSFQSTSKTEKDEYKLTVRENEILYSLTEGLTYKEIAEKYFISISTIRTHISRIYEKLHVNSKSQAVALVLKKRR